MIIKEAQLRNIVRKTISNMLKESLKEMNDDEYEETDDWYDETDEDNLGEVEPTAAELERIKSPELDKAKDKKKAMVDRLLKQILARQGRTCDDTAIAKLRNKAAYGNDEQEDYIPELDF